MRDKAVQLYLVRNPNGSSKTWALADRPSQIIVIESLTALTKVHAASAVCCSREIWCNLCNATALSHFLSRGLRTKPGGYEPGSRRNTDHDFFLF